MGTVVWTLINAPEGTTTWNVLLYDEFGTPIGQEGSAVDPNVVPNNTTDVIFAVQDGISVTWNAVVAGMSHFYPASGFHVISPGVEQLNLDAATGIITSSNDPEPPTEPPTEPPILEQGLGGLLGDPKVLAIGAVLIGIFFVMRGK